MDKAYLPDQWEPIIRAKWETEHASAPDPSSKKEPFCIIFPPPNANGSLHVGHAMYVFQDIMCRRARQQDKDVFWVAGTDHAGIETQFVFEKHLAKQGKSRFDYDRDTLYSMIQEFVAQSKGTMKSQLNMLGFSLDWTRECYTLDPEIIAIVHQTYKKLFDDGLIYRADRLVNYCCRDGTSFSDLEVESEEFAGILYHISYGPITIATTRPETLLGDAAVMVHPEDVRYQSLIGTSVPLPLTDRMIPVIADTCVEMTFGSGAVKVTPAHDATDLEVGLRHKLPLIQVIGFDGRIYGTHTPYDGMKVKAARERIIQDLKDKGLFVKEEPHQMVLKKCYKCKSILEPLPKKQWYIKVKPLAEAAIKALESDETQVHPNRFIDVLKRHLDEFIDWNISRQIVWGIRIPAFQNTKTDEWCVEIDEAKQKKLIDSGLWVQDTDTFDTWFSSGQWPFATLQKLGVFDRYYPTTVMETGYDIARAWVARMMMLGIYMTGKSPFKHIYFHGLVRDGKGQKMSKSKGNVVDPLKLTQIYGTDALRAALVFETTPGADLNVSEDKVRGMRNFINKIWNIARFLTMDQSSPAPTPTSVDPQATQTVLKSLHDEYAALQMAYEKNMDAFEFSSAFVSLHEFVWHRFADIYIEQLKASLRSGDAEVLGTMHRIFTGCLSMLEPFIPFVVAAIMTQINTKKTDL
ncbi:MAG: valine--tRNA ligase [Candidatus Roizmanbacteria bacterium]